MRLTATIPRWAWGAAAAFLVWLVGHFGFGLYEQLDVRVYQAGAGAVLHGQSLYEAAEGLSGLRFTYPPLAALLLIPLGALPFWLAGVAVAAASCAALARICDLSLRHFGTLPGLGERTQYWVLLVLAFWCDPVMSSLWFGQVNLIIVWLVLEDLTRPNSRLGGIGTGLATAIKLTPAVFLALLTVASSWKRLWRGIATVALATAVAWFLLPSDSHFYWTNAVFDAPRMGGVAFQGNQSITGVIARIVAPTSPPAMLTVPISLMVLAGCLLLARAAFRAEGDDPLCWARATVITALGGLSVAPISWTHHWIWCIPAACLLGREIADHLPGAHVMLIWTAAVFMLRPWWWLSHQQDAALTFTWWQQVLAATDLLWAISMLGWYAWRLIKVPHDRQSQPRFN